MAIKTFVDYDSLLEILKPIKDSIETIETIVSILWKNAEVNVPPGSEISKLDTLECNSFNI